MSDKLLLHASFMEIWKLSELDAHLWSTDIGCIDQNIVQEFVAPEVKVFSVNSHMMVVDFSVAVGKAERAVLAVDDQDTLEVVVDMLLEVAEERIWLLEHCSELRRHTNISVASLFESCKISWMTVICGRPLDGGC